MKQLLTLITLMLIVSVSHAQMPSTTRFNPDKGVLVYIGMGGSYDDLNNLNHRLSEDNLPTTGKAAFSNILETDLRMKNLLVGFSSSMSYSPKRNDNFNTSVKNIYGGLNVGYYIVNSGKFHLAPQAGVGIYASSVKITQRKGYTDFNEVLANGNSLDINQYTAALDFCLKFDIADFTKAKTGLSGFRFGYRYGLSKRGWGIDEASNSTVSDSPKDRAGQLYALLTIGFGGSKPIR